ncbi:MAG: VOC family protein [Frankiaceae bacterium]|nr:VOC family protein [Frankiaceae bacterium]
MVDAVPEDYPRVIPYLSIDGAADAITFYGTVFGATERMRMAGPDGKIGHCELEIGAAVVMLADTFPDMGGTSPKDIGGSPVTLMVYVEDVDACFERALENGATALRKVEDQFYGDRSGSFEDPFGHLWFVASHIEDIAPDEMEKRAAAAMGS